VNSARFFSPVTQAKLDVVASNDPIPLTTYLNKIPQLFVAASAAYLALLPSYTYAQENHLNKVTFQISGFLTGLLINLYAIHYLCIEIQNERHDHKRIRPHVIVSFLLGFLSVLPIFCIQQMENTKSSSASIMISILVSMGSIPLQTLGFFEFCQTIFPKLKRLYIVNCPGNAHLLDELNAAEAFITKLQNGFNNLLIQNNIPNDFKNSDGQSLITQIINNGDYGLIDSQDDYIEKKILPALFGITGIFLAETVNLSFIQATYEILLNNNLSKFGATSLTIGIVSPMIILSAEFGCDAACHVMEGIIYSCAQFLHAIQNRRCDIRVNPPYGIHKLTGALTFMSIFLIACQSYGASIQFNNDTLKDDLSYQSLMILNEFTLLGSLLFNVYAINNIFREWFCMLLCRFGNENTKQQAEFYQFGQSILKGYQNMPKAVLLTGIEHHLDLRPASDETPNALHQPDIKPFSIAMAV